MVLAVHDTLAYTSVSLPRLLDWPRKPFTLFLVNYHLLIFQELVQAGLAL